MGYVNLIPAPQEVEDRKDREIDKMEGNFSVAYVNRRDGDRLHHGSDGPTLVDWERRWPMLVDREPRA